MQPAETPVQKMRSSATAGVVPRDLMPRLVVRTGPGPTTGAVPFHQLGGRESLSFAHVHAPFRPHDCGHPTIGKEMPLTRERITGKFISPRNLGHPLSTKRHRFADLWRFCLCSYLFVSSTSLVASMAFMPSAPRPQRTQTRRPRYVVLRHVPSRHVVVG